MNNIEDYIVVIPNILSQDLCKDILNEYQNCQDWVNAVVEIGENLNARKCKIIGLSHNHIIQKNSNIRLGIDKKLCDGAYKSILEYNKKFPHCMIQQDSGYDLLKYESGGFYITHTDSFKHVPRAVSCSFLLNDNFEGGEFAFFNRKLKYKIPVGSALMFPSNFMYPHEIMPITSGTRYSIVTWFV
jgi:predicted 2-oxoglutarate/Fe(II)-dependent dioxygenase YbiX